MRITTRIYLIGEENIERMTMATDRRNQVKNQKPNEKIHLTMKVTATATTEKEVKIGDTPMVAIE